MGTSRQQDLAAERKQLIVDQERAYQRMRRTGDTTAIVNADRALARNAQELYRAEAGICCRDFSE